MRHRLRGRVLRGRGLFVRGAEVRQEAVVKEAAHRLPSLGGPTDTRPRIHGDSGHPHSRGGRAPLVTPTSPR
ncbi:hypothetical protein GO001_03645 [Streptomyces sp. NRRL B-1677]|nr:hypothetical protein [Streptomyces sp. NRRL B-1677]